MGFRYRKSINLGGGFRINISKSGVGYSWGVKGYRITKTAKGTIRETYSIPGTGISYTEESRSGGKSPPRNVLKSENYNYYSAEEIVNGNASLMISDGMDEILSAASKSILLNNISTVGIIISIPFFFFAFPFAALLLVASISFKFYVKKTGLVELEYEIDEDQKQFIAERLEPMVRISGSQKLWRIMQSNKVIDTKYTAGAETCIKRVACIASKSAPFPFRTNVDIAAFRTGNETLLFLPDKLIIIQGSKMGALSYSDISFSIDTTRFIENEATPTDAAVVGQTWQYVNKGGGPDRRFKNNRKLPICLYGKAKLQSPYGLDTIIMFSNAALK